MVTTTILIKPASSSCNMVCSYCFYDDVSNCRSVKTHGLIQKDVWIKLVDDAFKLPGIESINFAFQGGEPLLSGIRFFKEFIDYTQLNKGDKNVQYSVQTNGTLITDEFCELFKKHDFLVGISIDGFEENHNRHRMLRGVGAFENVYRGFQLLKKHNVEFNVLTVLTKQLAKDPKRLYEFYQKEEIDYIQLVPCMPSFENSVEEDLFACTPESFSSFYKVFYEEWLKELKDGKYRSVGLFNDIVSVFSGQYPQQCGFLGFCRSQCVVESNGSIYPCDFYVLDEYEAGNVKNMQLKDIVRNDVMIDFEKEQPELTQAPCKTCPFINICNGGCKRLRETHLSDSFCGLKEVFKEVYDSYGDVMNALQLISNQN